MRKHYRDISFRNKYEQTPVRIVSDALIATGSVGEGRFIPLLIVDQDQRPDLAELIRIHAHISEPGDHGSQWMQLPGHEGTIGLLIEFTRPAELKAIFEFDIEERGGVVDSIIRARALYLQSGRNGDRLSNTMFNPRILVELGDLGIDKEWDDEFRKQLMKRFRRDGLSRAEARRAVEESLQEWRKMTGHRVPR